MPSHVGFTEFRQNLATHLDEVVDSRAPLLVTLKGAQHLLASIAELTAGKGVERDLTQK